MVFLTCLFLNNQHIETKLLTTIMHKIKPLLKRLTLAFFKYEI